MMDCLVHKIHTGVSMKNTLSSFMLYLICLNEFQKWFWFHDTNEVDGFPLGHNVLP